MQYYVAYFVLSFCFMFAALTLLHPKPHECPQTITKTIDI